MLNWLGFGRKRTHRSDGVTPSAASATLPQLAPAPGQAGHLPDIVSAGGLLQREYVLNRDFDVAGYHLRLNDGYARRHVRRAPSFWHLRDEVMLRQCAQETQASSRPWPLGSWTRSKPVFLDASPWSLKNGLFDQLPAQRFVLMLRPDPAFFGEHANLAVLDHYHQQHAQRFMLGLDYQPGLFPSLTEEAAWKPEHHAAALPFAHYIRLSAQSGSIESLHRTSQRLQRELPRSRLMIDDVRHIEELQACRRLPVELLQSHYQGQREQIAQEALDLSYLKLIEVLNLAQNHAPISDLVRAMKHDPVLSFKLLRYVNSVGQGLVYQVDSLEHALVVLGYGPLYRWLALLLFSSEHRAGSPLGPTQRILFETALVRGRTMELLGRKRFRRNDLDALFTTGLFSTLDLLFSVPIARLLESLQLPPAIRAALLTREGPYRPLLQAVLAIESTELMQDGLAHTALFASAQIEEIELARAQREAWLWAQNVLDQTAS